MAEKSCQNCLSRNMCIVAQKIYPLFYDEQYSLFSLVVAHCTPDEATDEKVRNKMIASVSEAIGEVCSHHVARGA